MPRIRPTRLLALGALALLGFLYWKPLHTYLHAKKQLQSRNSQVHVLQAQQAVLKQRIAQIGSTEQLTREARRLGLVKPGEQLFIVKGIPQWRKKHH
ncbi:MAG TPA: septum formation initiator family protein [Gaiellaceae bacterium]|nr:septum formation initiator family protein [Gaiellaceae bacterium]